MLQLVVGTFTISITVIIIWLSTDQGQALIWSNSIDVKSVKMLSANYSWHLSVLSLSYSVSFVNAKHFSDNSSTYSVEIIELFCTLLEVLIDFNQKLERTCSGGFVRERSTDPIPSIPE